MSEHAKLSPSSAYRWMNCPGSLREIGALPPGDQNRESIYSRQGSAAHHLAETCLTKSHDLAQYDGWLATSASGAWELIAPPDGGWDEEKIGDGFVVDEGMIEAVQVYLDEIARIRSTMPAAVEMVEQRVFPLADREADIFGTVDHAAYDDVECVLYVTDYKHGAGVFVSADANPQARCYGLGALRKVGAENVARVELAIVQPRAMAKEPVRREILAPAELVAWGEELKAAADATAAPDAPLKAGAWCGFCPVAPTCSELRAKNMREASADFNTLPAEGAALPVPSEAFEADPEVLARALRWIPIIDAWCREVEGYGQRRLERGGEIPGFKLVRKRGRREWTKTEAEIIAAAKEAGVKAADLYKKTFHSPAQIEKIKGLGKKFVEGKCEKTEGGATIALASDPRPALPPPALADFPEIPAEASPVEVPLAELTPPMAKKQREEAGILAELDRAVEAEVLADFPLKPEAISVDDLLT